MFDLNEFEHLIYSLESTGVEYAKMAGDPNVDSIEKTLCIRQAADHFIVVNSLRAIANRQIEMG